MAKRQEAPPELLELARDLKRAKRDEARAKELRLLAEEQIIELLKFEKPEGAETYAYRGSAGECVVALKRPVTRKVDTDTWLEIRKALTPTMQKRVVRTEFKLETKAARKEQDEDTELWRTIAPAITSKPGKISVEIKELNDGN